MVKRRIPNYGNAARSEPRAHNKLFAGAILLARAAKAQAMLRGRTYCIADDIHDLAVPVLAHRVRLTSHADGFAPTRDEAESAVRAIVARIPVPL